MEKSLFDDLLASAEEMLAIEKGEQAPQSLRIYKSPNPREIRQRLALSQAQFAHAIGVSTALVQSWEQQRRRPDGAPLKLLRLLDKQPELLKTLETL